MAIMTEKRFSGKGKGFWWNCKYMESPIGVAYCKKKDDFCLKGKCNEIESNGRYKGVNND